jgi:hypothetical protein
MLELEAMPAISNLGEYLAETELPLLSPVFSGD